MFSFLRSSSLCCRIIGWLGATLAALLLGGCSTVKFGYGHAPDLSYWWLDSYLELSDAQSAKVRTELTQLLAWHRSSELPRTAQLLKELQGAAAAPISAQRACALATELRAHLNPLFTKAEPVAAELALSLSAVQIQHLERRLSKNNAEYREKWGDGSAQERLERRLKASVGGYENLYGKLEAAQLSALQASVAGSDYDVERSLAERRARQQDLLQTLRRIANGGTPMPDVRAQLRAVLERSLDPMHASHSAYSIRLAQQSCETFSAVHNAATTPQRERAVRRLAAYERDARELAAPP